MIELNLYNLAWASGFFDGEGSTSAIINQGKLLISVSISQVDVDVLRKFHETVKTGSITGPYKARTLNSRDRWIYSAYGFEKVQYIMCLLWNNLSSIKKNQFSKALISYERAIKLGLNKCTEFDKRQRNLRQLSRDRRIKLFINSKDKCNILVKNPFI